ncbi:MAG TPA: protein-methionine-sulfoxide reductase heme-binding subunit MsrQ [Vicinamibacterales bacterium]|jgi:sulfoxide reductase heme-binding subunit YedZ|nr:protein-methionine-sulfoxide reductase heme-binding subunit MsrQ [Vicinamibacterales bacterium]
MSSDKLVRRVLKPLVFVAALGPAGWLVWAALTGNLSANPLSDLTNETGVWTLRFLCVTLALTPLRRITGWNSLIRFRRMVGLFAFFYGSLHFLTYVIVDRFAGLDFPNGIVAWTTIRNLAKSVGDDIYKRPFITVGFTAWSTMVPLAVTSTAGMIRRLGGRLWNKIHRLVYVTASAGVIHYWWLVKADVRRPITYGVVVGLLLGYRLYWARVRSVVPAVQRARPRADVPKGGLVSQ